MVREDEVNIPWKEKGWEYPVWPASTLLPLLPASTYIVLGKLSAYMNAF